MKKKIFSLLLAALMLVSLLPVTALAEGGGMGGFLPPDFPTTSDNAWSDGRQMIFCDIGQEKLVVYDGSEFVTFPLSAEPTNELVGDGDLVFTLVFTKEETTLHFNMVGGTLESIKINNSNNVCMHYHDDMQFQPWTEADSLPATSGNYYLTSDVTLSSTWQVPTGTVNLCLNGHVIRQTKTGDSVIRIPEGATLNLYDCDTTTTHYFTYNSSAAWTYLPAPTEEQKTAAVALTGFDVQNATSGTTVVAVPGGVITGGSLTANHGAGIYVAGNFTMNGGAVAGNSATASNPDHAYGAGVYLEKGEFTLKNGNIVGNQISGWYNYGGGVFVSNGTFTMDGGNIAYNLACFGGGIGSKNGSPTIEIKGGAIEQNKAANSNGIGGGVFLSNKDSGSITLNVSGGAISGNTAVKGGGIGIKSTSPKVTLSGSAIITGNTATDIGGGVFSQGTFTMTGGEISGNTVTNYGGGVYVDNGTVTLGGTARITGNVIGGTITDGVLSGGTTNNLYLYSDKTITLGTKGEETDNGVLKPASGMLVGVTTKTAPTESAPRDITAASGAAESDTKYFSSDNNDYAVAFNSTNSKLQLAVIAENDKFPVWVGGVQVHKYNADDVLRDGGTVKYTPDATTPDTKGTLTLNGATLATDGCAYGASATGEAGMNSVSGIKSELPDLTVALQGTNQIGKNNNNVEDQSAFSVDSGIYSTGNIAFTGSGDLNIYDYCDGIIAKGNVTFDAQFTGKLTVVDYGNTALPLPPCAISADGDVTINNGTLNLTSYNSNGITAGGDVTISGGEVNITNKTGGTNAILASSDVVISGGEHTFDSYIGICLMHSTNTINVTGGKLTVTAVGYAIDQYLTLGENMVMKAGKDAESAETMTAEAYNALADFYSTTEKNNYVTIGPKQSDPTPPSSGGSSTPTVTVPVSGDKDSVKVGATVSGNTATVKELKDSELEKVTGGEAVEFDLTGLKKSIDTAKLPTATVEKIGEQAGMSVKLTTATVTFDQTATQEISDQANGKTVELVVDDVKEVSLNAVQKEAVRKLDTALIIDAYLVSGGERLCSESKGGFGGGKATVALPFEIKNNRTAANYSVFYVDDEGNLERLAATYDTKLGAFVFDIEHFSNYVVAFDENGSYAACPQDATCVYAKFTDADTTAWYHDGVHFCVEREIMQGVSDTQFAPSGTLSRAMIVTMLWRLEGEPVANYAMTFKDVAAGTWYTEAIRWAQSNKIVEGYSADSFGPNDPVTREQLAAILYRYAQSKGEGFTGSWMFLLDFVDRADISSWADEAVHWCSMKGIVNGKTENGNKVFDPRGKATRAEAASMVQRFCEATSTEE